MIKKNILYTLIAAVPMLALPYCLIHFVPEAYGKPLCLLLFFGVDPILTVVISILSGKDIKHCWFQPLLCAILFVGGGWLALGFDVSGLPSSGFPLFGVTYLVLGYQAAFITAIIVNKKKQ